MYADEQKGPDYINSDTALAELEARLPASQDDDRVRADSTGKAARLRAWLEAQHLAAALISRRDNFAWLTTGGDNHVLKHTEVGVGHLLVTADRQILLAYNMDGERLLEEELPGQGYELVMQRWYQGDPRRLAFDLADGRIAADTPLPGADDRALDINRLHEPLTALELDRCRWLGRQTGLLLEAIAHSLRPGMAEREVAGLILAAFALKGIELEVVIVGSDERIGRYRHAMPSDKRLERVALLHPAARRWGLHANVNRCISFGPPPAEVAQAHRAATTIEAQVLKLLAPGVRFAEILEQQKSWYRELGYPEDWGLHFQGGPTGYMVGDPTRGLTDMRVVLHQAYDWFITVEGVQVEELSLLTEQGLEIPSLGKDWPLVSIPVQGGKVSVPDIFTL